MIARRSGGAKRFSGDSGHGNPPLPQGAIPAARGYGREGWTVIPWAGRHRLPTLRPRELGSHDFAAKMAARRAGKMPATRFSPLSA